jgi:hypothetical protein
VRLGPTTAVLLAISLLVCCGATSGSCNNSNNSNFSIGPSKGEVIGVAVGAVAIVAAVIIIPVEINKSHHTLKGCVLSTPAGLELRTDDNKTYTLSGTTADISPGNTVRLHGDRRKTPKGAAADPEFVIQKMQKNYGPCQALASPQPALAPHS